MGKFSGPLRAEKTGENEWKLTEPLTYVTDAGESIVVPKDFEFAASVPRVFWWFCTPMGVLAKAACIHDYLYVTQMIEGKKISRSRADWIFLEALEADGVDWIRRNAAYSAVRLAGWTMWD